ncbi:SpaH/EbpB family LPXTG-anchored major pilin [Propionibacterium australiense]|uniref:Gram-positive pilin backbone subunit 2, Cna-B-like domain n=1 Tax=Propionibacterium australiense TaxID=119981 RepID=A0A383S8P5_9ACTN|nr:SpaH/EbpB family LPXTG-anchored major pilin [Propionibacterium australiense]RLP08513.1 isopeptide-forming domain-containing fimbrial protein [Propionibacterium australiense]RLP08581.1 isopeptide-forming domain-containing fimbrial protein [Propionibacterium australiense]SYZ33636.1 Gram-positive pilin backbone subunit 2, Cna-B-like domain [Propionibacterium australiense]VEH88843.1 Fimbrial subunit type 1 precursor [Propionibacterium australiense]
MQTNKHPAARRLAAMCGVVALSLSGLIGGAGVASADPNYGNINQDATGSIIIHKHLNGDGTAANPDGTGSVSGDPVGNVTFAAYPITSLDLSKSADWDTLSTLEVPDSACANPTSPTLAGQELGASAGSGTTNGSGEATIGNLPVKAYLVCETSAPGNIVQKAKPFVVTIPYPYDGSWLYDVNVYPKNTEVSIDKTIETQTQYGLGSTVSFPVTTTVPALDDAANFQYFQIKDEMDSRFSNPAVSQVTLGGTPLVLNTDYTVTTSGNTITVKFTSTGLTRLKSAAGQEVRATFQGTVTSVGDGAIKNTAQLITDTQYGAVPPTPPEDPTPPDTPPTTPEVQTNWGDLKVHKVDADNHSTGLAGAIFEVYNAAEPYASDCANATRTGDPISVSGQTQFTSDESGVVNIAGLYVSDSVNTSNADQRCYVLVEVEAPAGFVKQNAGIPVTVTAGTTNEGVYGTIVLNSKQAVPGLPLTGAQGKVLMMVVGAILIITAGTTAVVRSRRAAAAA